MATKMVDLHHDVEELKLAEENLDRMIEARKLQMGLNSTNDEIKRYLFIYIPYQFKSNAVNMMSCLGNAPNKYLIQSIDNPFFVTNKQNLHENVYLIFKICFYLN